MTRESSSMSSFNDRLEVLHNLAATLVSDLSLEHLLQQIADSARELAEAQYSALGMADTEGQITHFITAGITEAQREVIGPLPTGRGLLGALIRERRPIRLKDMGQDPRSAGFPPGHPQMTSFLGIPILSQGGVRGSLYLTNKQGAEEFSAEDQRLLETLARFAAVAIQNAETHRQTVRLAQELATLYRIDQTILANPEMEEMARILVTLVAEVTGADRCVFDVPDAERRMVRNLATYGYTPEELQRARLHERRMGEGLAGWVMMTGHPSIVSNLAEDARFFRRQELLRGLNIASGISVPVINQGQVVGALTVAFSKERRPLQNDVEQLIRLGTQVALAYQNWQNLSQIRSFTMETIIALAEAIEHRDPYTGGHCRRLGLYSRALAEALGLSQGEQQTVQYAATLHDIGKIAVPESMLMKPGPLTPEEWPIMKQHPFAGSQIAKKVGFLQPMAPLIYHHHERYDGAGYLDGLSGERIPIGARIIAVVDAYDAMTNDRPYRKALTHDQALEELRKAAGAQLDPRVVEAFLRISEDLVDLTRERP